MGHQLQIEGLSDELGERLQASAHRNFRNLDQEALTRIQFSFEIEDSLRSKQFQKLIEEGLAGIEARGSASRLREIAAKTRANAK